jgi:endoglucanase
VRLIGLGLAVVCVAALLTGGSAAVATPDAVAANDPIGAPVPVVAGNRIVDARSGNTWVPHGVNWPSFEYACIQGWGYSSSGANADAAKAMALWGINVVRIPLNEDCWLGTLSWSGGRSTTGYRTAVTNWVQTLNSAGLAVILDLHWTSPTAGNSTGQRAMADARSIDFWTSVAGAFASNRSVIFDAFNEPYSRWNDSTGSWAFNQTWSCWQDGGCQAPTADDTQALTSGHFTTVGMTDLVAAIRAAGAHQPIMLGGLDYSNDLSGWLEHRPADNQLIASWHAYKTQACQATCRESVVAQVAKTVPVLIGEFGQTDGGHDYLDTLMTWADAHGIGYAPWAWWIVSSSESLSASRYALIADANFTPKAPSGTTYHDHLAAIGAPIVHDPLGSFTVKQTAHRSLTTTGWAFRFDTNAPATVRVTIDTRRVDVPADRSYPVLARGYASHGTHHGFRVAVGPLAKGIHTVCVAVQGSNRGWTELACQRVRVK